MSTGSGIEWTDDTWNPVVGCTRVSAGCDNCYAAAMTHRLESMHQAKYAGLTVLNGKGDRHFNGTVRCVPEALEIPLRRRKPTMYFVNSMSDLFHKDVPFEFIDQVFAVMALTPQHTYQVLTKRPDRMAEYLASEYEGRVYRCMVARESIGEPFASSDHPVLPNIWLGTSCEDQATADERIPHLLKCPAAVRFLSCEPLLGSIDIARAVVGRRYGDPQPNWVIVGGESGGGARPCDVAWIREIVGQCRAASVPVFCKQLGKACRMSRDEAARPCALGAGWDADEPGGGVGLVHFRNPKGGDMAEWSDDLRVREWPRAAGAALESEAGHE